MEADSPSLPSIRALTAGTSWRVGRLEQVIKHRGAIHVTPLEIVDIQDQRMAIAESRKHLTQRGDGSPTQLLLVGNSERPSGRAVIRYDTAQNGKGWV